MAKILVTGGAGFIGSHVVDELIADNHVVEVIDDLSSGSEANLSSKAKLNKIDIRTPQAREYLKQFAPDVIVHAAAQMSVRNSMQDPSFDTEVNVLGLVNLLQAFHETDKKPHFILLSTGGAIYGEQDTFPAKEDHKTLPESVYGLAKKVSEQYLELWQRQFGINFAALRLGNVYGPRQNPHGEAGVVAIFYQKLFRGETPLINGTGEQTRDYIYVKDVSAAIKAAVDRKAKGIFNIGTAKETNVNQLYKLIFETASKLKADVINNVKHGEAKSGEQMRSCIDPSHAKEVFGWSPKVELKNGLEMTAEYFVNKG